MRLIGNILWFFLGGWLLALLWTLAGLVLCVTLIGIPFGVECFKIASLMLHPFGHEVVYGSVRATHLIGNILWILFFGWELAIASLVTGLLCCITIVGIPFGLQGFKFAQLSLMPFGAKIA
ncbi:MAG: YccF domain-containing protein [Clostridia bacterium]|nr:YccF domain-containing protein [Clostridia bacterium]